MATASPTSTDGDFCCGLRATQACLCFGGASGVQTCADDGQRYTRCICAAPPPAARPVVVEREVPAAPAAPPPPPPGSVSAEEFRDMLASVSEGVLDDDKVQRVRDLLRGGRRFTCEQSTTLMRQPSLDDARVEIGAMHYPRLVDRQNFYLMTRTFILPSSADDLRQRFGQ